MIALKKRSGIHEYCLKKIFRFFTLFGAFLVVMNMNGDEKGLLL